jgi:hypothetical protein
MYRTPSANKIEEEGFACKKWSMFSVNEADSFYSPSEAP